LTCNLLIFLVSCSSIDGGKTKISGGRAKSVFQQPVRCAPPQHPHVGRRNIAMTPRDHRSPAGSNATILRWRAYCLGSLPIEGIDAMVRGMPSHDNGSSASNRRSLDAASAQRRAEIAKSYLLECDVLTKLNIDHDELTALRKERKILAVWNQPESGFVYPPFQFNETGVTSVLEPLLACLDGGRSGSSWGDIEWLMTPHVLLDAQTPAEVLPLDPARVLGAAKLEFSEHPDAGW